MRRSGFEAYGGCCLPSSFKLESLAGAGSCSYGVLGGAPTPSAQNKENVGGNERLEVIFPPGRFLGEMSIGLAM